MARRWHVMIAVLVLLTAAVPAVSGVQRLAVYTQGFALVEESLSLEGGVTELSLPVPVGIIPESLAVDLTGELRSYSYHYVPADRLLEEAVGQRVEVVDDQGNLYRGILLGQAGRLVLEEDDGSLTVIEDVLRIRLLESTALALDPRLHLTIDSEGPGEIPLTLLYLTRGLSWQADYVALLAADENTLSLRATVTLVNDSGYDFTEAETSLIAGEVNAPSTGAGMLRVAPLAFDEASFAAESASEYYRYRLLRPVTLADGASIAVPYEAFPAVRVAKSYTYDATMYDAVRVTFTLQNDDEGGLGVPLPGGAVRVYQTGGEPLFLGQDIIGHTPVGEEVALEVGSAFDLVGERTVVSTEQPARDVRREMVRITLRNHKEDSVAIDVLEHFYASSWEILSASHPYQEVDANTVRFAVEVPAGEDVSFTYTAEYQF